MNQALLRKILPAEQWSAPCVVILDANASIQPIAADAVQGGAKIFSPRAISGRIPADAACLSADGLAVLLVHQQRVKMPTGGEVVKQALTVVDAESVVAVEFHDTTLLAEFGVLTPALRATPGGHGSDQGTLTRPK